MKKLFTLCVLLLTLQGYSQFSYECATTGDSPESSGCDCPNLSTLGTDNAFIPDANTPIKYIALNLVFLRKDDGTGGFQQNNIDHQKFIDDVQGFANWKISNLQQSNNCIEGYISDSRIRFTFNEIYYNSTIYWNSENSWNKLCPSGSWYINPLDNIISANYPNALNIYFTESQFHYNQAISSSNPTTGLLGLACADISTCDFR